MKDFFATLFGDTSLGTFVGYLVLVLLGHILNLVVQAADRDPLSATSPFKFSWSFLLKDNAQQTLKSAGINFLIIILCLRFAPDLMRTTMSPFAAIGMGYGLTALLAKIKDGSILDRFGLGNSKPFDVDKHNAAVKASGEAQDKEEATQEFNIDNKNMSITATAPVAEKTVNDAIVLEEANAGLTQTYKSIPASRLPTYGEVIAYAQTEKAFPVEAGVSETRYPTADEVQEFAAIQILTP